MNILIVGNGFDLSHYLPTKYDHFMRAMDAIENWDEAKGDMGFDDLFGSLYEKEDYFFGYTKAMYKADDIKLKGKQVYELQEQLKENSWYRYFSEHVRDIKTWIDFEMKINQALELVSDFIVENKELYGECGEIIYGLCSLKDKNNFKGICLSNVSFKNLEALGLVTAKTSYLATQDYYTKVRHGIHGEIKNEFLIGGNPEYSIDDIGIISFLNNQLMNFKQIFNYYLENIVSKLNKSISLEIYEQLKDVKEIYSFNYTNTFERLYMKNVNTFYLHGKHGIKNNIVLGISELTKDTLFSLKAFGFTKYHQKLLLKTDYGFLDEYLKSSVANRALIELDRNIRIAKGGAGQGSAKGIINMVDRGIINFEKNIKFYIWGHSLDYSDEDYIKELFSFNEPYDENVRIVVYYFDDMAKFNLLNNLVQILKKNIVENWMKKDWLTFEENPDIAKINGIEPVELPKMTAKAS